MKAKTFEEKKVEVFNKSAIKYGMGKTYKILGAAKIIEEQGINNFIESIESYVKQTQKNPKAIVKLKLNLAKHYILYLEGGFSGLFGRL
jgi:K+-sensing histidine kinase KdpD